MGREESLQASMKELMAEKLNLRQLVDEVGEQKAELEMQMEQSVLQGEKMLKRCQAEHMDAMQVAHWHHGACAV